jgi:hypothetical protein
MNTNEQVIEQLILSNRRAIRYHLAFALGLFLLGAGVITGTLVVSGSIKDIPSGMFGIAGAFTSSLSALQIKEILSRREKAEIYTTLKSRYKSLTRAKKDVDEEERKRLIQLMSQIVEKAALG